MLCVGIFQVSNNNMMNHSLKHGKDSRITFEDCPHHGIEEWLLMQTFYHGLISCTRESIDAAAGVAFLSLKLSDAKALVEKMASNSTCNEEHTQPRKKGGGIHYLKEPDMVTANVDAKIDLATERANTRFKRGGVPANLT